MTTNDRHATTGATDDSAPRLSVIVPCFNEEESLGELHRRVTAVCVKVAGNAYELVLVDDGSIDRTRHMIADLAAADPQVVGVLLSRNHGHQLALSAGLTVCTAERVLVLDADLQDPPELLPEMMRLMDAGADVVYGQRDARLGETWFKRRSAAWFYRVLNWLVDIRIPTDTGDFRLMSRRVLDHLNAMPEQYRFIRGMVSWLGFRQVPLVYERKERFAGTTKYPLRKMLRFAVDAITSFSIRPLRFAASLGVFFGLLGIVGLAYALVSWLSGNVVPGWTSVIFTVLIIGSVQLLVLGILGEYMGRLYIESKRRPMFIIDRVIRGTPQTHAAPLENVRATLAP
jgi:polyisoprenyl-phosphate glycosyltransferase